MIYELRIYHIYEGRMDAIHDRFKNHTISLFADHGMKVVDFWEDADGNDKIYYILEHKDKAARDAAFKAFGEDERWIQVKADSEKGGPIVAKVESYIMKRVPYSPVK